MNIISTVLSVFKIVAVLIPIVTALVERVEQSGASGQLKKQAVMDAVKVMLDALGQMGLSVPVTMILTVLDFGIDGIVAAFNLVGIFTKKPQVPASPTEVQIPALPDIPGL